MNVIFKLCQKWLTFDISHSNMFENSGMKWIPSSDARLQVSGASDSIKCKSIRTVLKSTYWLWCNTFKTQIFLLLLQNMHLLGINSNADKSCCLTTAVHIYLLLCLSSNSPHVYITICGRRSVNSKMIHSSLSGCYTCTHAQFRLTLAGAIFDWC